MHKFLRAAGFSMYQKKKDIEKLLDLLETQPSVTKCVQIDEETNVCEMRTEIAPGIGLSIVGELNEEGDFEREFYFPYVECAQESSTAECSVQRHVEKETYAGMVDESCVGISLIFYVQNFLDYREKVLKKGECYLKFHKVKELVRQLAEVETSIYRLATAIKKTQKQIQMAKVAAKNRNNLIEAAKNGDEDAMETLTIEDIDLYSKISRRAMKEDLYSIIDSSFMPCGIECDQYSVIGEIKEIQKIKNKYTNEEIYWLNLECSDLNFIICINGKDLLGEPAVGRRFKGQIWMQGILNFQELGRTGN